MHAYEQFREGVVAVHALGVFRWDAAPRDVYEFDPPDGYSYTLEASPDGADWQLYLRGAYRRDRG